MERASEDVGTGVMNDCLLKLVSCTEVLKIGEVPQLDLSTTVKVLR